VSLGTDDRLISHKLWPAKYSDLIPCDLNCGRGGGNKKVHSNSLKLNELLNNIYETTASTEVSELKLRSKNFPRDLKFV
jgi:hypothetical protein